jgi:thiol-disulfide isomerase/thioredoxin
VTQSPRPNVLDNRWVRALAVAVLVAAWPACNRNSADPNTVLADLNFVLKDTSGADVNLASFKGKPLLINMWATWCGPCKAEVPWFSELAEKYKDRGFTVIGISTDDTAEDIKTFAENYGATYPLLVGKDRPDVAKAFDAENVLPVSWLIRPDGTVHTKVEGIHGKDWFDQHIQELF